MTPVQAGEGSLPRTTYSGKLVIFTSFYELRGYAPYIKSLSLTIGVLERLGITYDYQQSAGDFHIDRAINDALTHFMNSDATDFLMIDADISWEPEGLLRTLTYPEEIVSGVYRMKHRWEEYVGCVHRDADGDIVGRMLPDGTALVEADRIPGGFTRIKKTALQRFHDSYPNLRAKEPYGLQTVFFERFMACGEMHSQDYGFSRRWKDLGGQLWIDPQIKLSHWGMVEHAGDFDSFLRAEKLHQKALDLSDIRVTQEEEKAFAIVRQMAARSVA